MPMIDQTTLLLLAALGVLVILLVLLSVLLAMVARGRRETPDPRELSARVEDGMRDMEDALQRHSLAQREEVLRTQQAANDSVLSTLNGFSQQLAMQLQSLQKQTFESNQAQEMRQHRMQRANEETLARFEQRMQEMQTLLDQKLLQNENRLERMRLTLEEGMQRMQTDNAKKLEEMRKTVDEKLHETLDQRLNTSFSQVSQRLEQVYRSLGEVHSLASGVSDLKRVLSNVKTRGVWGEIQLGNLLEQALTDSQYAQNVAVRPGSSERVEFAVCLPGRHGDTPLYLPIDSKFPQEDYARLADASQAGDAQAVEAAQKSLLAAVRTEAKRIESKYVCPPYTTDFGVMFLPLEGLYAEVMRHSDIVGQIQRELRVVISGPSTLLALLNSLQMGFRTLAIEQRSAEVWKLLGAVKTDFDSFSQVLEKTQEKLQQATHSIDSAFVRTRSIARKLRRVETLDESEAQTLLEDAEE